MKTKTYLFGAALSLILICCAGSARAQATCASAIADALDAYALALDQLEIVQQQCATPAPPPPSSQWPTAATTGPRPGVQLVSCLGGNITASRSGCIFSGAIVIAASGVTISDSVIQTPPGGGYAIGDGGTPRTGTVLQNLRISGMADGKCIYLSGGNWSGDRLDISGCTDAVHGSRFSLTNSFVHDLAVGGERHSDGTQTPSIGKVVLRGNSIVVQKGAANSAVFLENNFGPVDDVLVEGNLLGGGTYTVYCGRVGGSQPTNVRFLGNTFVRGSSAFGIGQVPCKAAAGFEWSGNVFDDGAAVPVP